MADGLVRNGGAGVVIGAALVRDGPVCIRSSYHSGGRPTEGGEKSFGGVRPERVESGTGGSIFPGSPARGNDGWLLGYTTGEEAGHQAGLPALRRGRASELFADARTPAGRGVGGSAPRRQAEHDSSLHQGGRRAG